MADDSRMTASAAPDVGDSSVRPGPGLSSTPRTSVNRHRDRASNDRRDLFRVLDAALICHLGVLVDGAPMVLPTAFGFDPDGLDEGGTLYLHGSVASQSLRSAPQQSICVSVTVLDGLVLARSAFHHSMNYRSAVVYGVPRVVDDPDEKARALDLVVDHTVPGRAATMRAHSRKELAATTVLALGLSEASVKARSGGPVDDEADIADGCWAGVLPLRLAAGQPIAAADSALSQPPPDVLARAAALI